MKKITFLGLKEEKERFIARLQEVGVTHLILPAEAAEPTEVARELQKVAEARKFLSRRLGAEAPESSSADYAAILARREDLGQEEVRLQAEIAGLRKERALLEPFGQYDPEDLKRLRRAGLCIQFFRVPLRTLPGLPLKDVAHEIVSQAGSEAALATFSETPLELGLIEEKLPEKSLSQVQAGIDSRQERLSAIQEEYARLSQEVAALGRAEADLTDRLEFRRAVLNTESELEDRIFLLRCWSPVPEDDLLARIGPEFTLVHYVEEPTETDRVPVLLENKPAYDSGSDLVQIYSHPSYNDFDPSGFVLYAFALFFGFILGDAGYGAVLLGLAVFLDKKIKARPPLVARLLKLMYLLSVSVIFMGIISASYFGVSLSPGNILNKVLILDYGSKIGQNEIMRVSILIGMAHISLSLGIKVKRQRDWPSLGWIIVIWSGYFLINSKMGHGQDNPVATAFMVLGLALVFIFTSTSKNILIRILSGLNGLLGIVQVFSDVLSYLRLFALGIATVYMAQTFNMLSENIAGSIPVLGYVLAALVLVVGHFINLGLGVMGGVIHGLRLNFLEWYRWSFEGDGLPFKPFRQVSKSN